MLLISSLLFLSSCTRQYKTDAYNQHAKSHEVIALLPYQMIFEGKLPKNVDEEQLQDDQIDQSFDFQRTLYYGLQKKKQLRNKNRLRIRIQNYRETNKLLSEAGVVPHEAHQKSPAELGAILGVDAILYTTAFRQRFKSDAASVGIDVADQILTSASGGSIRLGNLSRTNFIEVSSAVFDVKTEQVLWEAIDTEEINYSRTARQSINQKNSWLARRFPYREKDL